MRRKLAGVAASVFAAAVMTACDTGATAGGTPTASSTALATQTSTATATAVSQPEWDELSVVAQVLSLLPDTPENRQVVQVNNYRALADALGIEVPGPDATHEEVVAFKTEVFMAALDQSLNIFNDDWISGYSRDYLAEMPDLKAGIGFDARDVTASGRIYEDEPWSQTEIVVGEFDPELTRMLLEECADCAIAPEIVSYKGETYYRWGGEGVSPQSLRNRFAQPIFDYLGRGGQLFVTESFAVRTIDTADMKAIIDASLSASGNLLALADWALAAEAISGHNPFATVISGIEAPVLEDYIELRGLWPEFTPNLPPEQLTEIEAYASHVAEIRASAPDLPEYMVAATGLGIEGGRQYVAFAVVFADEEQAQAGLAALEARAESGLRANSDFAPAPWSEVISQTDLAVSGGVVSGKVFVREQGNLDGLMIRPIGTLAFLESSPFSQFLLR